MLMRTVEQENHKFTLQISMLAVGATSLAANLFLPPSWASFLVCITAGVQAFLLLTLLRVLREPKRSPTELLEALPLMSATSCITVKEKQAPFRKPGRWEKTDEFLAKEGGE